MTAMKYQQYPVPNAANGVLPIVVTGVILSMLFLPGCDQGSPNSSASKTSRDNLRRLALAMRQCNDSEGAMPAHALFSKEGVPLLRGCSK